MRNILWLLIVASFFSCSKKANKTTQKESKKAEVVVPIFNADSAYRYVKKQVDLGVRIPNTKSHEKCANYLEKKLQQFGAKTIVQKGTVTAFDGTKLNIKNIIGSFNPEKKSRVLLFAHWDTRPWADNDPEKSNHKKAILGANDGASGVGVLLEMARQFGLQKPNIGVDIIFFDAEDYGASHLENVNTQNSWCLGTQYWAKNRHEPAYHAKYGVLLDMVGAKNATFYREGYSDYYGSYIVDKIWNKASLLGFANYFINEKGGTITDDHTYVNEMAEIPSVDIIHLDKNSESGFFKHWHTTDDTMKNIDKKTLKAVGTTLLYVVYEEKP